MDLLSNPLRGPVTESDSDALPEPRKPYSRPEVEELGAVDEQTNTVSGSFAGPGDAPRPAPHVPR
jgi:hypothetical protein